MDGAESSDRTSLTRHKEKAVVKHCLEDTMVKDDRESGTSEGLHIREKTDIADKIIELRIDQDEKGSHRELVHLDRPTIDEIREEIKDLMRQGIQPENVYIGLWSKLRSLITDIWPEARVLIEYDD